jgi:DNA-binding NarL/FixJ family response regulator
MVVNESGEVAIAIIEDDTDLQRAYQLVIGGASRFQISNTYTSVEEAIDSFNSSGPPPIVLTDIQLPGLSGIEGIIKIKERWPDTSIVVISIHEGDEMVFRALKAGAVGYITKGTSYLEIVNALEELLRGGSPMSSKIARMVVSTFSLNTNSVLSNRERQILSALSKGKTYSQIADELFISKETSRTHIRNIYLKLHVNSKSEAIQKAMRERLI